MGKQEHNYIWYEERFCRDLGLCKHAGGGWGAVNHDIAKVEKIAQYYLDHPEYCRVGREMLLECLLISFENRLISAHLSQEAQDLVRLAMGRALNDQYDRDALRPYWETPDLPQDPNPLGGWMHEQFPDFVLPPSVWENA